MSSVRVAAWHVLRSGARAPLRLVDREASRRGFDARDRGLLRQLVGTELRRRGTLRALVRDLARRPPKPDLALHLHLGLVQLLFLDRIPDHAAVSETVEAVRETLGAPRATSANALLREATRRRVKERSGDPRRDLVGRELCWTAPVFRDPDEHPLLWYEDALSMPAALMKRWVKRYGEERAAALARSCLREPDLSLRVARGGSAEVAAELAAEGLAVRPSEHPRILLLPSDAVADVARSRPFTEGRVTVQGGTALRAAELVGASEGEDVLDLCAAPGGKTCVLAEAGARVVAVDRDPFRLGRVGENAERLGLAERVRPVCGDGTRALGAATFDAVLVDAPCSNTGTLGARPAARWRFGPATQRDLVALQERLIAEGAERVRPGGRLVWSTCSLEPEENGQLVRRFLEARPDWREEARREALPDEQGGPVDGGAAFLLRRA